ncbi:MAG: leucine-rich repeat protein [Prevotella sp.]|nr:leucine-rich repeat protein [Prevotella sp.]
MKRLLTLTILLCFFSVSYGLKFTVDDITYTTLDNASVKVTGFKFSLINVVIPSQVLYNNVEYQVKEIGDKGLYGYNSTATTKYSKLETLVISEGIEKIGINGIASNNNLKSVSLPNSLTELGNSAFYSCDALTTVTFPNGSNLVIIGDEAFYECKKLESFVIPSTVTYLGKSAFRYDEKLSSITIPENILIIQQYCFSNCKSLNTVILHDNITRIEKNAFSSCTALENIDNDFPETLEYLGQYAFENVPGIKHLILNGNLGVIDYSTFAYCKNLEYVWLKEGINTIRKWAFGNCLNLKYIVLPSSIETVESGAFGESNEKLLDYVDHNPRTFFFLSDEPFSIMYTSTTDGGNAFPSLGKIVSEDKFYVKESAVEAYKTKWRFYQSAKEKVDYMIPFNADLTYSTNYREFDMDFHVAASKGNKPYVATNYSDKSVTFTSIDDYIVPTETGIVIRKTSDEDTWFQIAEQQGNTLAMNNYLKGVTYSDIISPTTDEGNVNYVLYNGVFCRFSNSGMLSDHKAYLQLPPQTAESSLSFSFSDISDGITEIKNDIINDNYYDLSGIRVEHPKKGLYIKNGKKIIFK